MNDSPRASSLTQVVEAHRFAEREIARDPTQERPWTSLIEGWLARGLSDKAVESALAATIANPTSPGLQAMLAFARLMNGDSSQAEGEVEALWKKRPTDLAALTRIGQVAAAVGRHDLARAALERALALRPDDPQLQFNCAIARRHAGECDSAEQLYDSVIRQRPDHWEAYRNRSELRRQTPERNHIAELEAALGRVGTNWGGTVMLQYALGKEREDLGETDAAFAAYDTGAKLRRRHLNYGIAADLDRMRHIGEVFDEEWLRRQPAGCQSAEPIFIVGLPCAGSALLEGMIGSHPEVFAAGELHQFGLTVGRLVQRQPSTPATDPVAASSHLDPSQLGAAYVASTRPRTGRQSRFIDRMPDNFLQTGLIAAALPNAAIVHLHRAALDAGFAAYRTLFNQAYPFSYDLRDIGSYIGGYEELMAHWHRLLPGRIIDVAYEDLVREPERVVGEVLRRCGLSYEPGSLSFADCGNAVSTIGSWRHYAAHLGPLLEALAASGHGPAT